MPLTKDGFSPLFRSFKSRFANVNSTTSLLAFVIVFPDSTAYAFKTSARGFPTA